MEYYELAQMRSLPLELKILKSQQRVREWYEKHDGDVYVAFSGGKDSTVLLHLVRSVCPTVPAVFINTGLEYPEIVEFVKTVDSVEVIRPRKSFVNVINEYGYPLISKEQAQYIDEARNTRSFKLRMTRLYGNKSGRGKISNKWRVKALTSPYEVSNKCCDWLKKKPALEYEKRTGRKPLLGVMAGDSSKRVQDYLRYGCNSFNTTRPVSRPLGFWTEADIWEYIKKFSIPYSRIYDMGYTRTGCMFCGFGLHCQSLQENKFLLMKRTHPTLYHYCMTKLGMDAVLSFWGLLH